MAHISVLGTGRMGSALAIAFARAGHDVTVWNRTAAKAKHLEAEGVRVASSVVDAINPAELVVDNVSDYEASAALVRDSNVSHALRDKTFVELASGRPQEAASAEAWARGCGIRYLDGAIVATPDFIGQPGCTILDSGPRSVFETHQSTLAALGDGAIHIGADVRHANVLDNAILVVFEPKPSAAGAPRNEVYPSPPRGPVATATTLGPAAGSAHHILTMSREYGIDEGMR